eukprot:g32335.t1
MKNEVTKARSYCEASGSFQLNYQMTSESLGKGTFGKVCKAVSLRNGKDCAVKVVHLGSEDGTLDEKTVEEARQEEHIMHRSQNLPGRFGTMPYMSPEMAASAGHCFSTDVWSLGATLYVLIFGDLPYRPPKMCREHLKMAIITGDLVKQMLSRDRSTRPTAARVLTAVLKPGSSTRTSRVQQAFCTAPGKLKTALHLKVHFGCWKAQKSEDEDDVLGKDTQFARAVTY